MRQRFGSVLLLLASLALTFAACGASSTSKPLTAAQVFDKAQHAKLKTAQVNGVLVAQINGVTFTGTMTGAETTNPDRSKQVTTLTHNGVSVTITDIEAGSYTYAQNPGSNAWQKSTRDKPFVALDYDQMTDITLVGIEKVNGQTAYHIRGTAMSPETKTSYQESFWFRTSDFYPVQNKLETAEGPIQSGTITYSAWDKPVTIDIPTV